MLAAGLGTRLDPLTRLVAKPAMPLGSRSLIEHVLDWLVRQGIRDVVVNLHHLPESITRIAGDGTHLGLRVRYSWEREVLGSAGGPRRALALIEADPFVIVNGDTLCHADVRGLLDAHTRMGGDVTMAVVPNHAPERYNGIRAAADGSVAGFVPKGQAEGTWHFIGVQVTAKRVFAPLAEGTPAETVAGVYREIIRATPGRIRVWPAETSFLDVGTPADYLEACLALAAAGTPPRRTGRALTATVDRARRTVVWSTAAVPGSARLENTIVAGAVTLPEDFVATNAIIVPASLARPDDAADIREGLAVFPLR